MKCLMCIVDLNSSDAAQDDQSEMSQNSANLVNTKYLTPIYQDRSSAINRVLSSEKENPPDHPKTISSGQGTTGGFYSTWRDTRQVGYVSNAPMSLSLTLFRIFVVTRIPLSLHLPFQLFDKE